MGKGRGRAVEKGVLLGQNSGLVSSSRALTVPQGPVFYPTEEEFEDPLGFIDRIRAEAEPYGICRIVPPDSWKPPFALNLDSFTFPTKTQAIHQLQVRPPACDPDTFELEYNRFLEEHCGRKLKKRVVFEGEELDFCKLFNAVKRYGGYERVVKEKKWGEVFRFVGPVGKGKVSECSKHVLCQLYREHLHDYEKYYGRLTCGKTGRKSKRGASGDKDEEAGIVSSKRRRKDSSVVRVKDNASDGEKEFDQICEQCNSGLHGEVMLLCDRCDRGWHIYCLSPPLKQVPYGNWYCLECVNSDKDTFGFVLGKQFSLEAFRRRADRAKKKWFGSATASRSQIEKKFWQIVEGMAGEVEVIYGNDLDTSLHGSGFPRANDSRPSSIESEEWDKYSLSPWNLNNLPKLQGSMLRAVRDNINGVTLPWLYIGMLFSSFCWHFEDHCFYSMNYLHWGEAKCWYSVPGSEAQAFEQVMRNSLPDLFDAQPDLLFQLVTMLNPSVLQDNGVPVYTVLQEPGNFVITFPRSYHGGFNFGLNCAEAVNFAPADWLPYGGFGAERYRLYHKPAVICHEELLCVVAKTECNEKVSPYLKKEMLRIFNKEKHWRERLWRNGIVKSSQMSSRKHPEYVSTEEDPTCIICQQYLYLSAVVCSCRPNLDCIQYWEHRVNAVPETPSSLSSHSCFELNDLALYVEKSDRKRHPELPRLGYEYRLRLMQVKGGRVTHAQLAEQWLLNSFKVFQKPFHDAAYSKAIKEAEQFLWAGLEMEPVHDMAKRLLEARKWAIDVGICLKKSRHDARTILLEIKSVLLEGIANLLSIEPMSCRQVGHTTKVSWVEKISSLTMEFSTIVSFTDFGLDQLEILQSRACELPICLEECKLLVDKISSAKSWKATLRDCIVATGPDKIEIDILHKLKSEMWNLHVELSEKELLLDLLNQVDSWKIRSGDMLNGLINLKELEILLKDAECFPVNIPELELLRQHYSDAICWISNFQTLLMNIQERVDQESVVKELTQILKDGELLRVQVNELPLVELELKKAFCRVKATKVLGTRMPLDYIQNIMSEAIMLKIESEEHFVKISGELSAALSWEERACKVLGTMVPISEFEDVTRASEKIFVELPSFGGVHSILSVAQSWLKRSEPFLAPAENASKSLLKVEALKDLVDDSKLLKVVIEEPKLLEAILKKCKCWEDHAHALLECAEYLVDSHDFEDGLTDGLASKLEDLRNRIQSTIEAGISLGFDFSEISTLESAFSKLNWCFRVLFLCSGAPSFKEVKILLEDAEDLSVSFSNNYLVSVLLTGVKWLKEALDVCSMKKRCKLLHAEEILAEYEMIKVPIPVMNAQLVAAVKNHKSWQEQVHVFFNSSAEQRSWSALLQLKELGNSDAFNSFELDRVTSEIDKIEKWILRCKDVVEPLVGEANPLFSSLVLIKDRWINVYDNINNWMAGNATTDVGGEDGGVEDEEAEGDGDGVVEAKVAEATEEPLGDAEAEASTIFSVCRQQLVKPMVQRKIYAPIASVSKVESLTRNGCLNLISRRKRPELKMLVELLSAAQDFCVWIEEVDMVHNIVEQALSCRKYLTEIVNSALAYVYRDVISISHKLLIAMKALAITGVHDNEAFSILELALTRHSWKVRTKKLLEGSQKPLIQQIQRMLKEGSAIKVPSEDYFMQKLTEVKQIGLQWAETAKKVACDSGALGLDEVFELIAEGEDLPVCVEKEIKLLRDRSVLYCICRKPYDQRPMIACDSCDEWYHFDCVNLQGPLPKTYMCPACMPLSGDTMNLSPTVEKEESMDGKEDVGPQTPSPRCAEFKRFKKMKSRRHKKKLVIADLSEVLRHCSGTNQLWWSIRKPLRRTSRKRAELHNLSPFFHMQL
ncbi:hypothetical protein Scep_026272 [Stephania cephalantha]|uniref:[Histone H3]-trimethyl-L-lysine(4) demethylase n=1 Tax=Stephania cephalantha TaxID=152367 RepID=A0AAP0EQE6_9MAGN